MEDVFWEDFDGPCDCDCEGSPDPDDDTDIDDFLSSPEIYS